jgi:hypothetical protein
MNAITLLRCLLGFCAACLLLEGCAVPSATVAPGGPVPDAARPNLRGQNLLYVSGGRFVTILTYPQGRTVGRFPNVEAGGECADSLGDIYVTSAQSILIFYRGDLGPPTVLNDPGFVASGCAVDPTSGDLAVTNALSTGSQAGSVAVYTSLYTSVYNPPKLYTIPKFYLYAYCSYDSNGNLFVDGTDNANPLPHVKFAELAKGNATFSNLRLSKKLTSAGGVQWDGKYIAIGDPVAGMLYQLQVSGLRAKAVSSTKFNSPKPLGQFWIAQATNRIGKYRGQVFISTICCGSTYLNIGYWKYPAGGSPIKTIPGFAGPYGLAVSVPSY